MLKRINISAIIEVTIEIAACLAAILVMIIVFATQAQAGDYTLAVNSRSVGIGYTFNNDAFVEVVKPRFGTRNDSEIYWNGGTGVTTIYVRQDSSQSDTVAFNVGKAFRLLPTLKIHGFAGVHRYTRHTKQFSRLEQFDEATGAEIIDRVISDEKTKHGLAGDFGVGVAMPLMRHLDVVFRVTKYVGLGEQVGEVGIQGRF